MSTPSLRRLILFSIFVALLVSAFFATRSEAQANSVKEIAPGVWFRQGDIERYGHCNNTIIEMKDYLIVVDANWPSGARLAMEDARKVSKKPVKYVFDTHHHGDHSYGNAVWTQAGAITLAYIGVAEEMKRVEPGRWQAMAKTQKDVAAMNQPSVEPPMETFQKSPHVISDGTRRVEFHHFGWAHTRGDGWVYLPKEQVLCSGDAAANGPWNYIADANIGNWPKVIEAAQKLKVKHVLPGHGPAGGPEVLSGQKEFFVELWKAAEAAVRNGTKPEDVTLPESVKLYLSPSLKGQVKAAMAEITEKKPTGEMTQQ